MQVRRSWLVLGVVLIVFLLALAMLSGSPRPGDRVVGADLEELIAVERASTAALRSELDGLRHRLDELRQATPNSPGVGDLELEPARDRAGTTPIGGPGLVVELDDSSLDESPSGNINDLVIHSQDVRGVVNALWRSGAEAISINGERLVATSAVLCVGNTLLLNGTVHSPPYVLSAVGADNRRFAAEPAVLAFQRDASVFGLGFSLRESSDLTIPSYSGPVQAHHAAASDVAR